MKKIFLVGLMAVGFLFQGCEAVFSVADEILSGSDSVKPGNDVINNSTVKNRVYNNAVKFVNSKTEYVSGAMGRFVYPFDCSGLVTRCYDDALKGTNYKLPYNFTDTGHPSAESLRKYYSTPTNNPERGDLIFLNFNRSNDGTAKHVGIFDRFLSGGKIQFIDASDYWNYENVVDFRTVSKSDDAFVSFGVMDIKHK